MTEPKNEPKTLLDLSQAINDLDLKLRKMEVPEVSLIQDKMDKIGERKQAVMEKLSEARSIINAKIDEGTNNT